MWIFILRTLKAFRAKGKFVIAHAQAILNLATRIERGVSKNA